MHGRHGRATTSLLTSAISLCVMAAAAGAGEAIAQEQGARLDALLERISFNNAEKPETLGKKLAELDPADLAKLCDLLVEPGTGNDTKPRMALHALTWYLGSAGTAAQRDKYIDVLCEALDSDKAPQVKAFFIRQLQLIGTERAVPTLAKLLNDVELCHPATTALIAIGGDRTAKAFRDALPNTQGSPRVAIIDALGLLRDEEAADALQEYVALNDEDTCVAAFAALASMCVEPTAQIIQRDEPFQHQWYRQGQMADWSIQVAAEQAAAGKPASLGDLLSAPVFVQPAPMLVHWKCAALHALAQAVGAEAVDDVVAAMTDENPELRAAARELAVRLAGKGVTEAYVLQFYKAAASARADILDILRRRGDRSASSAALAGLKDEDKQVRLAAIAAAAELGREDAVEPFVTFLETADEDERAAVANALTRTPGDAVSDAIGRALWWHHFPDRQAPYAIPLLLDVIARRKAEWHLDNVYRWIRDSNEDIKVAAINAAGALADQRAARRLLDMLEKAESEAVRKALESALVATCQRVDSAAQRPAPILKAITQAVDQDDPREYCSLLRVAAQLGGAESRVRLLVAAHETRPEVKEAAIRAFDLWPDSSAAEAVLELADSQTDTKLHVLAMRAYLRMVGLDEDRPAADTLKMYTAGLEATRRVEERRSLLSGLGEVKDGRTLDVLSPYLDDEQLRSEAGSAMIGVARGLLPTGWAPAREALEQVIAKVSDDRVRQHAQDVLREVGEHEDYITDWQVSGPYKRGGKKGNDLFDVAFPPEETDAVDVEWKEQPVTRDPARYWLIDLARSCGGSHPVGYLRTHVYSPQTQEVLLELGSDDGIKVWLNGQVIHANNVPRGCDRAQDKVKATLNEGRNELLLKITNIGGAWAACARVRTPDGGHLDGLKVDARRGP
jgi:HEAT repeat protein